MNECFQNIDGEQYALAMPFFHTFTGSDSTSAFYQKSKLIIHSKWMESPFEDEVTAAFQRLSWCATESTIDDCIPVINKFIVFVYGGINITLNSYRFLLFKASSSNNLRDLPPSEDGLELHIRRSQYQAGHVWGNSTSQFPTPPLEECGWSLNNGRLSIQWVKSNDGEALINKVIKTCKCQIVLQNELKCNSCTCSTQNILCLDQCKCSRSCSNS